MARPKLFHISILNGQTMWMATEGRQLNDLLASLRQEGFEPTVREADNTERNRCIEFLQST